MRELLATIEQTNAEADLDVDDVVRAIQAVLDAGGQVPAPGAGAPDQTATGKGVASTAGATAAGNPQDRGQVGDPAANSEPEPAAGLPVTTENKAAEHKADEHQAGDPGQASRAQVSAVSPPAPGKPARPEAAQPADATAAQAAHRRSAAERNQIVRAAAGTEDPDLVRSSQRLNLIASELQEGVMKTRMQPLGHIWSKFPRVVRDLGNHVGKQVSLEMIGKETELDRTLLEAVKDPLTHLVRNAVDHGIEDPARRATTDKPAIGTVTLRAYHEGGQVVVEVCDDGGGIDPQKVKAKALEKGLKTQSQLDAMQATELLQLIFLPGLSTAAAVTNVSGRGVGMDVVKTNIENIGGTIEVESEPGLGTTCRLRIPLTLAIVPALTVECAADRYAIPQVSLLELVSLDGDKASDAIEHVGGAPVYRLRGQLLPLVHLADVLQVPAQGEEGQVLIAVLQAEGKRFGLVIDKVLSTEEIVVKPLTSRLKSLGTYSGATILGDGTVALILDIQTLARRVLSSDLTEQLSATGELVSGTHRDDHTRVLLAGIGSGRRVAIPLSMVTRLEQIPIETVEHVGSREVVQYRGAILPLLRLDQHLGAAGAQGENLLMVVYTFGGRSVAIVVEEILDIVEEESDINSDIDDFGLLGSSVIKDKITELLDVRAAILAADPSFFSRNDSECLPQEAML
ncbi:MAG: chemotaxis protein CheA [Micrococcales bacterium]|nr:MAG: chemotaxis protein CheA [Micrococcales bacterium]